jgi:gamma-glutamylcyclotransferase
MADDSNILYFAYGSNMDPEQMASRCHGAPAIGIGTLKNYRFIIDLKGVASILPDPTGTVYGVVWSITVAHKQILDGFEGVEDKIYYEKIIQVTLDTPELIDSLVYIATETLPGLPRDGYLEKILRGANHFSLPPLYIEELSKWAR